MLSFILNLLPVLLLPTAAFALTASDSKQNATVFALIVCAIPSQKPPTLNIRYSTDIPSFHLFLSYSLYYPRKSEPIISCIKERLLSQTTQAKSSFDPMQTPFTQVRR